MKNDWYREITEVQRSGDINEGFNEMKDLKRLVWHIKNHKICMRRKK